MHHVQTVKDLGLRIDLGKMGKPQGKGLAPTGGAGLVNGSGSGLWGTVPLSGDCIG